MANLRISNEALGVKKFKETSNVTITDRNGDRICLIKGRLYKSAQCRCPKCKKQLPVYDTPTKNRRWRTLDVLDMPTYIIMDIHRVFCPEHGILTEDIPFALPGSGFTIPFELQTAWLARRADKTTVSLLMRIAWNTVGNIIKRVKKYLEPDETVRFNNLRNIGVDETSYKKGYKYITTVVDLDANTVIWVGINHGKDVLSRFFELLTEEQRASIETISGDGAKWIDACRDKYIPHAVRGLDPFHCVEWAQDCLDTIRRQEWQEAKKELNNAKKEEKKRNPGRPKKGEEDPLKEQKKAVKELKNARYALTKNPEHLTVNQQAKLDIIVSTNKKLTRAYQLKEKLRLIFKLNDPKEAREYLHKWLSWAQRCRIPEFVELGRKIKRHEEAIIATIERGLSSSKVEALNNKIKIVIKRSYGFRNLENLKAMVLLCCSNMVIPLPNRNNHQNKGRKAFVKEMI
jgi:transposase